MYGFVEVCLIDSLAARFILPEYVARLLFVNI